MSSSSEDITDDVNVTNQDNLEEANMWESLEPGFGVRAPARGWDEVKSNSRPSNDVELVHNIPTAIMLSVKALDHKDWTSLRADWKTWKYTLEVAMGTQNFSEKAKHSMLVMRGGPLIQEVAQDGDPETDEENVGGTDEPVFSNLLKRIEKRVSQVANINYDMARLNGATQSPEESIESFGKRLRDLAKLCNMDKFSTEMMIRNRLFKGALHGARLLEISLPDDKTSALKIVQMGTRLEELERSKKDNEARSGKEEVTESTIANIGRAQAPSSFKRRNNARREEERFPRPGQRFSSNQRFTPYGPPRTSFQQRPACGRCGTNCFFKGNCFARGLDCHSCGKRGHIARMCRGNQNVPNDKVLKAEGRNNDVSGKASINEISNTDVSELSGEYEQE